MFAYKLYLLVGIKLFISCTITYITTVNIGNLTPLLGKNIVTIFLRSNSNMLQTTLKNLAICKKIISVLNLGQSQTRFDFLKLYIIGPMHFDLK